jgi:hypothetical protein
MHNKEKPSNKGMWCSSSTTIKPSVTEEEGQGWDRAHNGTILDDLPSAITSCSSGNM